MSSVVSESAERVALGAAILDDAAARVVVSRCPPDAWSVPAHAEIAAAIRRIVDARRGIDAVILAAELDAAGRYQVVGGAPYLSALIDAAAAAAAGGALRLDTHIRIIEQAARARRIARAARRAIQADETGDSDAVLAAAREIAAGAADRRGRDDWRDAVASVAARGDVEAIRLRLRGQACHLGAVDLGVMWGWLWPGQSAVVAGHTSVGKTAVMATLALAWTVRDRIPVTVVTLEDSARELAERCVAGLALVPIRALRTGAAADDQRVAQAQACISDAPLDVVAAAGADADDVGGIVSDAVRRGSRVVMLDYLQAVSWGRDGSEYAAIQRTLGVLDRALDERAVAIVGSQLSRGGDGDQPATMRRLRGSGVIEERARKVLLLHRDGGGDITYDAGTGYTVAAHRVDVEIAKNKGPTGRVVGHVHVDLGVWWPGVGGPRWTEEVT